MTDSVTAQPVSPPEPTVSARELYEKAVRSTWSGIEARPTSDESALLSYIASLELDARRLDALQASGDRGRLEWTGWADLRKHADDLIADRPWPYPMESK